MNKEKVALIGCTKPSYSQSYVWCNGSIAIRILKAWIMESGLNETGSEVQYIGLRIEW